MRKSTNIFLHRLSAGQKAIGFAILVIVVAIWFAKFKVRALLRDALVWIEQLGASGQVLFVAIYVVATVLLILGSALGLGAGALFDVVRGSLLVSVASTFGARCAFLLGRYLARGWIAKKIENYPSFAAIDRAVAREGWKTP